MELVYLYVEHLGMCIDNTGINFSKNYKVAYDSKHRNLKIEKKDSPNRFNIYGDNIQDINILVGKNGMGKSTIMRLLGLPEIDRNRYFNFANINEKSDLYDKNNKWFAIYHLYDNKFAIEGFWVSALLKNFLDNFPEYDPLSNIEIQYDFNNNNAFYVKPINELDDSQFNRDSLFYIYFQNNTGVNWFNEYIPKDMNDNLRDDFFHRLSCNASSYESVTKYLIDSYRDYDFSYRMGSKPGTTVEVNLNRSVHTPIANKANEDNEKNIDDYLKNMNKLAKEIYGNKETIVAFKSDIFKEFDLLGDHIFTIKQLFIISYLEILVYQYLYDQELKYIYENGEAVSISSYVNSNSDNDPYNSRIKYLLNVLDHTDRQALPNKEAIPYIIEGLDHIPDEYYKSKDKISMPISELEYSDVYKFMKALDMVDIHTYGNGLYTNFKVTFSNMSSGEAHFIDVFASIHAALQTRTRMAANPANPGEQTCILLLDEPDMSFHPEWSRTFIDNLTHFLNNSYKDINFQVIITTHSPLMLSDIQSDSIYCLGKDDEGNLTVSNPKYGLLSGINDILIDGFFTESLFGKFAEKFANGIVTRLNELEEDIDKWQIDKDDFDEEYKDLSKRIDILGGGLIKDSLMQRLTMARKWLYMRNGYDQD